jgi:hypothetical protein
VAERAEGLRCPSAQPDMEDARVFGVIAGTPEAPRVAYLKRSAVVEAAMLAKLDGMDPTHVFRFSAKCEEHRCAHFADGCCSLGQRIAERLDPVVTELPSCQLRADCRWYAEAGGAACLRCPQITTLIPADSGPVSDVALPD